MNQVSFYKKRLTKNGWAVFLFLLIFLFNFSYIEIAEAANMGLNASDKVGIGTNSPSAKLDVLGSLRVSGQLNSVVFDKLVGSGSRIVMTDSSGTLYATSSDIAAGIPNPGVLGNTLYSNGSIWKASTALYNNGTNVGIGTNAPIGKLDVTVSSSKQIVKLIPVTQADYSYFYLKLFEVPDALSLYSTAVTGRVSVFRSNDIAISATSEIYAGRGYHGSIYFNQMNQKGSNAPFSLVSIVDGGKTWAALLYDAHAGAGITAWSMNFTVYNSDSPSVLSLEPITSTTPLHSALTVSYTNTIFPTGNVGIGTASPAATLDVQGTLKVSGTITTGGVVNANGGLSQDGFAILNGSDTWLRTNGTTGWYSNTYGGGWYMTDTAWIRNYNNKPIYISGNGTNSAAFMNGKVGIGTAVPAANLDVVGNGQFTQPVVVGTPTASNHAVTKSYLDSALGNPVGSGTSGQTLRNNGTSWVANSLLYNNGTNIGIGTTAPSTALQVVGTVTATQFNGSGAGLTGTASSLIAGSANYINSNDGDRNPNTELPTTSGNKVRFDFSSSSYTGTGGNYAGVMTYAPWTGTTSSTGDASYQLAFGSTATNANGIPQLRIRNGIDSTWNGWKSILMDDGNGNVGIGTTNPGAKFDISYGGIGLLIGADNAATTRTDATMKYGRIVVPHYTNTEEPVSIFTSYSSPATNGIQVGGGTSLGNAATDISFFTAANNTTTMGTERMRIASSGNIGIGTTSPAYKLDVNGAGDFYTNQIHRVGTPAVASDAATKGYVDSAVGQPVGTGTSGQTLRNNGTGWVANSLLYNNGTNIGIGTNNPGAKLVVSGPDSGDPQLRLMGTLDTARWWDLGRESAMTGRFVINEMNTGVKTERLTILMGGNVGIGTTSPTQKLVVIGNVAASSFIGSLNGNANTAYGAYLNYLGLLGTIGNTKTALINQMNGNGSYTGSAVSVNGSLSLLAGNWSNDATTVTASSDTTFVRLDNYGTASYGTWLVTSYSDNDIYYVGRSSGTWTPFRKIWSDKNLVNPVTGSGTDGYIPNWNGTGSALENSPIFTNGTNVGIGSATPGTKLDVAGTGKFSNTVVVGTPTDPTHAATKSYVDTAVSSVNATLLDGIDGLRFVYGSNGSGSNGASSTQNVYELSQYKSGFWDVTGASWTPTADWYWGGTFAHQSNSSTYNYSGQLIFKNGGGGNSVYARTISAGTASAWSRLLTDTSNVNSSGNLQIAGSGSHYISNGSVGIGTTNPLTKLQVGDGASQNTIRSFSGGVDKAAILSLYNSGNREGFIAQTTGNLYFGNTGGIAYTDAALSAAANMTINSSGNVGIGTTAPGYKLDVSGTGRFTQKLLLDASEGLGVYGIRGRNTNEQVEMYNRVSIGSPNGWTSFPQAPIYGLSTYGGANFATNQGNVGIGTTTPAYKLDVNGAGDFYSNQIHRVGTPAVASDAATKGYVDSAVGQPVGIGTLGQTLRNSGTGWVANSLLYNNGTNIGIGTTNPGYKLEVAGVVSAATGATGGFRSSTYTAGQNLIWAFGNASTYGFSYKQGWPDDIRFHLGDFNNPQFLIRQDGNVGIGTTSPISKLHILNTTGGDMSYTGGIYIQNKAATDGEPSISFSNNSNGNNRWFLGQNEDANFRINYGTSFIGSGFLFIDTSGNIGLGTTTPGQKLDVVGSVRASSQLISSVANGTAPLVVTSKTLVSNLNADLLDGQEGSYYDQRVYNSNTNYLGAGYISGGLEKPTSSVFGAGKLKLQMLAGSNIGAPDTWNDVLWMSSYTGSDVKGSNALIFSKSSDRVGFVRQNYDSPTWGTYREFYHTGNSNLFTVDWKANNIVATSTITAEALYDRSNVIYKLDPSATGEALKIAGTIGSLGTGSNYFSGSVGIGTVSPSRLLHVRKASVGEIGLFEDGTQGILLQTATGMGGVIGYNGSAYNALDIRATTGVGSGVYLPSAGGVGIGTTNPGSYKLYVNGGDIYGSGNLALAGTTGITLSGVGSSLTFSDTAIIRSGSNKNVILDPGGTGKVGVGINPSYPLDVNGDINTNTNVRANQVCLSGDCRSAWPTAPASSEAYSSDATFNSVKTVSLTATTTNVLGTLNAANSVLASTTITNLRVGNASVGYSSGVLNFGAQGSFIDAVEAQNNGDSIKLEASLFASPNTVNRIHSSLPIDFLAGTSYPGMTLDSYKIGMGPQSGGGGAVIDSNATLNILSGTETYSIKTNKKLLVAGTDINSDRRLKYNIKTVSNPLDKVMKLRGVTFNWKKSGVSDMGVIAQEVKEVFPSLVSSEDEIMSVNYTGLIGPLIEAIKAQQLEIKDLQKKVETLERKK